MASKWNPYPKIFPKEDGAYLVTLDDHSLCVLNFLLYTDDCDNSWEDNYTQIANERVMAWQELPTPYYPRKKRRK